MRFTHKRRSMAGLLSAVACATFISLLMATSAIAARIVPVPGGYQHGPNSYVAVAPAPNAGGSWIVTAHGNVFPKGGARFYGSPVSRHQVLINPVVGIGSAPHVNGYWIATASGRVYTYGKAHYYGSAKAPVPSDPIVGIAVMHSGNGYWLLSASGKVYHFGGAVHRAPSGSDILTPGTYGYDVSYPQCGESRPNFGHAFVIVGVNDGHMFSTNPCLRTEWSWALTSPHPMLYINTDNPGYTGASAYAYGEAAARASLRTAAAEHINTPYWWLDVETTNQWSGGHAGNTEVLLGMIHVLRAAKRVVGIYSTGYQWGVITGGYHIARAIPQWVPGAPAGNMGALCAAGFNKGRVWMTQSSPGSLDYDYACR